MTDQTTTVEVEKTDDTTTTADTTTDTTKTTDTATETGSTATTTAADTTKTVDDKAGAGEADKAVIPDNWREMASAGDDDTLKLLKRYGSLNGVAKALVEKDKLIRSGKIKRDQPDASDEKAMAEWRKEQGIPDDPTGYVFPDTVKKRMTDDDKPLLSSFTEYAHKKGASQAVVDVASEWYFDTIEQMETDRIANDTQAAEDCEDSLRKDWAHGEYKGNMTLGKRYISSIPGVGEKFSEFRGPDGRRLGDIPEFIAWASDRGRQEYGDVTFANSDSERKHTARREEIEKIRNTDFDRYESEGLDKELLALTEKDLKRGKR